MNPITKMLSSVMQSSAKSLLSSGLKKTVGGFIKKHMQKSPETIEKEIVDRLGFSTSHYKLDKDQVISFKSSPVFLHEWLTKSPITKDKIIRDEENGEVFYLGSSITNTMKLDIINEFVKNTGVQSPAVSGHLENALRLFDPADFTSGNFKKHFSGWDPNAPSVIDGFMTGCFGTALTTDLTYSNLLFRRWITGAARRIISPGSVLDICLTLQGAPGAGKTAFFKNLLPVPFEKRTGQIYCDVKNSQKFAENLIGLSISNFDELTIMDHPDSIETFKMLLSSQSFITRLPWRRDPRRFDLRCAFAATTNKTKFINDNALLRRLCVIELNDSQRLNFDYLFATREGLWREAVWLAERGDTCIMTPEEQKQIEEHNVRFVG